MSSKEEANNAVLGRLWRDSDVRQLREGMLERFPGTIADNEVIVDEDHLSEAGYVGKPPRFRLRVGRYYFYRHSVVYQDYWIRFNSTTPTTNLYSIFKEIACG